MQVALSIWKLKEKSKTLDEHRANCHMRWRFTRTKLPKEMAVYQNKTAKRDGGLPEQNCQKRWRFALTKPLLHVAVYWLMQTVISFGSFVWNIKKKTNRHMDDIVKIIFPFHTKWKIFFIFTKKRFPKHWKELYKIKKDIKVSSTE